MSLNYVSLLLTQAKYNGVNALCFGTFVSSWIFLIYVYCLNHVFQKTLKNVRSMAIENISYSKPQEKQNYYSKRHNSTKHHAVAEVMSLALNSIRSVKMDSLAFNWTLRRSPSMCARNFITTLVWAPAEVCVSKALHLWVLPIWHALRDKPSNWWNTRQSQSSASFFKTWRKFTEG